MLSHSRDRFYAYSIAPIATLFYFQPALATAVTAAFATATGIQEHLRRRKFTP